MSAIFEKLHSLKKAGMEILSIWLKATKSTWLKHCNVYLSSTLTQHNLFDPSLVKPGPSSLILSNLNGHFQMRDSFQPQDQHGDEILDWILDNDLHILNDGSATRTSRITGNERLFEFLASMTSSSLPQLFTSENLNPARDLNLQWLHMCEPKSTPSRSFKIGADVQSYPTWSNRLILKAKEKALRSTNNHSKRIALDVKIPQRLQNRSSFRWKAEELSTFLPPNFQHRQNIIHFPSPPWQQSSSYESSSLLLESLTELMTPT